MGILGHSEPCFWHMHNNFFDDPLKGLPMHAPHESDADEVNPLAVSLHRVMTRTTRKRLVTSIAHE